MKALAIPLLLLSLAALPARAEGPASSNLPPDPFSDLDELPSIPDYSLEVDRSRGAFTLSAEDGQYHPGSHFGNWTWNLEAARPGTYHVGLHYESSRTKLGVQVRIGDAGVLKGYAPRTNPLSNRDPMIIGTVRIPAKGDFPVALLTGEESNGPAFQIQGIRFEPAPESKLLGQSIDGVVSLAAASATTYAETMRYEEEEEKDCLGYWTDEEDWAEWRFEASSPGTFSVTLHYGCAPGSEGSRVAVLVNDQTLEFTVADTGGFQSWQELPLGEVELLAPGVNQVAVVPLEKAGRAVMDLRKVVLEPVK